VNALADDKDCTRISKHVETDASQTERVMPHVPVLNETGPSAGKLPAAAATAVVDGTHSHEDKDWQNELNFVLPQHACPQLQW